jgi:hypothetical protein
MPRVFRETSRHIGALLVSIFFLPLLSAAAHADTLSLDYWSGKSPMTPIQGQTLFSVIANWGDAGADPILLPEDVRARWSNAATIEITDSAPFIGTVHIMDGLYFTECVSQACGFGAPDEEWVVGNEGFRFHIFVAQASPKDNAVKYCEYNVGVNGFATGTGFGKWSCYWGPTGRTTLPGGSPGAIANALYQMLDQLDH